MSISFYGKDSTTQDPRGYTKCFSISFEDARSMDLSNVNGASFLRFLGLDPHSESGLVGEITLAEARRAIMKARATGQRSVGGFTREPRSSGHLVVDGVTRLDIHRHYEGGVDASYFIHNVEKFAVLVEHFAEQGATHIYWA